MSDKHRLLLLGTALAVVLCLGMAQGMAQVMAQGAAGGEASDEGAVAGPTPSRTDSVDTDGFVRTLYFLTAVVAGVAGLATVLLFMGMGHVRSKKKSEGERRLGRMLGESQTEFQEGREMGEFPEQVN